MTTPLLYLVFHHSASPRSTTIEQIYGWHRKRGFREVGYNGVIEEDGTYRPGRRLGSRLAANPPHNGASIAICITGDNTRDEHRWNRAQIATASLISSAFRAMGFEVVGHRDIGSTPTDCPGLVVRELL